MDITEVNLDHATTIDRNLNNIDGENQNKDNDQDGVNENKNPNSSIEVKGHEEHTNVLENSGISGGGDQNEDMGVTEEIYLNSNTDPENQESVEVIENTSLSNNKESANQSKHVGVIENKPHDGTIESTSHKEITEAIDNSTLSDNQSQNCLNDLGVIENKSNEERDTTKTDMIEFEVVGKKESHSDPISAEDAIENSNDVILGDVIPGKETNEKRRWKKELLSLGITDFKEESNDFDCYEDGDHIYRKYRLREGAKPNYRIPTSLDIPDAIYEPKIKSRSPSDTEETHQCEICQKVYFKKTDLRMHYRFTHQFKYTCSQCGEEFKTNNELISHKTIHEKENRSFLCHECKQAFSDHCDYLLHEITHTRNTNMYKCPECTLSYNKKSYEKHIYTHFNKPVTCEICNKVTQSNNLKSHLNKHAAKRECVECGKVCNDKSNYDHHMAIHTGVKLFQCLYCGKGFRLSQQLKVHTRIHTQERLYACNVCDKRFIQSTDMQRHVERYHNPLGKEECKICKKKVWYMAGHMKVHTAEKRFECPECGKKYLTVNGLKAHVVFSHSSERAFECKFCNMKFANQPHLSRHIRLSKTHKRNEYKALLKKKQE